MRLRVAAAPLRPLPFRTSTRSFYRGAFAAGRLAGWRVTRFAGDGVASARSFAAQLDPVGDGSTSAPPPITRSRRSSTTATAPATYAAIRQGRMRASGAASG